MERHEGVAARRAGSHCVDPGLERLARFDPSVHDQVVLAVDPAPGGRLEPDGDEGAPAGLLCLPQLSDQEGRGDHAALLGSR